MDSLAWAVVQDMVLAEAAGLREASDPLGTMSKMASQLVGFLLEVVGTLRKMAAVPVAVVQSPLGLQGDSPRELKDTFPVAHWHHQTFLTDWKPCLPYNPD